MSAPAAELVGLLGAAAVDLTRYFTPAEMAEWRALQLPHIVANWIGSFVAMGITVAMVFFGWSARLMRWSEGVAARLWPAQRHGPFVRSLDRVWRDRSWGATLVFVTAWCLAWEILFTPSTMYFALVYDRRAGLSTMTLGRFVWDASKGVGLHVLTTAVLALSVYGVMRRMKLWWVPVAVLVGLGTYFASGFLDPYKQLVNFKHEPLPEGPARAAVLGVLHKAGEKSQDVRVMNAGEVTNRIDAMLVGEGPSLRVVLYDTLVAAFTPRELAVAIAHEVGHLHDSRWWPPVGAALSMALFIFAIDRVLRCMARRTRFRLTGHADPTGLPAVYLLFAAATFAFSPMSAEHKRDLEQRADAYAVQLTGDPQAFIDMVAKLARRNKFDPDPPAWVQWRRSHPTIKERIAFGESRLASAAATGAAGPGRAAP